jgi:hypothetical protein
MSTNVVGAGSVPASLRPGRIAAAAVSLAIAISIGIGLAQGNDQDVTLDGFHPGHPKVTEDRQERITTLRDVEQVTPDSDIAEYKRLRAEQLAETRAEDPKRPPRERR